MARRAMADGARMDRATMGRATTTGRAKVPHAKVRHAKVRHAIGHRAAMCYAGAHCSAARRGVTRCPTIHRARVRLATMGPVTTGRPRMGRARMDRATVRPARVRRATLGHARIHCAMLGLVQIRFETMGQARVRRPKFSPGAVFQRIAAPDPVRNRSSCANRGGDSCAHSTTSPAWQPLAPRPARRSSSRAGRCANLGPHHVARMATARAATSKKEFQPRRPTYETCPNTPS